MNGEKKEWIFSCYLTPTGSSSQFIQNNPSPLLIVGSCCCLLTKLCPTLLWPSGRQPARLLCPWDFLSHMLCSLSQLITLIYQLAQIKKSDFFLLISFPLFLVQIYSMIKFCQFYVQNNCLNPISFSSAFQPLPIFSPSCLWYSSVNIKPPKRFLCLDQFLLIQVPE